MKKLFTLLFIIMLVFAACNSPEDEVIEIETFTHSGLDSSWTMDIIKGYEEGEGFKDGKITNWKYQKEGYSIMIFEEQDIEYEVNEEYFEEVITSGEEFNVHMSETIEIEGLGTVYGALVEDHATHVDYFYYLTKLDSKALSFVFVKNSGGFSKQDEANTKYMISTLKKVK